MAQTTSFNSSNTLVQCFGCGRLTWSEYARTKGVNGEACAECAQEWEQENEHSDYGNHPYTDGKACPVCHPEHRESRRARVDAHNAKLQIKADAYAADRKAKADAKAAAAAAKEATIKRCADCKEGRASSTSDFCSICRPYNPHTTTKLSKQQREHFSRQGWNVEACGTCGKDKEDSLHI